jgi:hypothetical protein
MKLVRSKKDNNSNTFFNINKLSTFLTGYDYVFLVILRKKKIISPKSINQFVIVMEKHCVLMEKYCIFLKVETEFLKYYFHKCVSDDDLPIKFPQN